MATALLTTCVFAVGLLYSLVGHAGASGYIAVMALFGLPPAAIKPTALILNILVATIGTWQFRRAGYFSASLFWPFALSAAPCAFLGGYLRVPAATFKVLVGIVLLASAARFLFKPRGRAIRPRPPVPACLAIGAALGLLAGMTGTGGGIFLTPLLVIAGWADAKQAGGVSAPFILLNSVSGLAGLSAAASAIPRVALPLALAAVAGGTLGSTLGSRELDTRQVERCLGLVLAIAGAKLVLYR